ncbi:peptidoglycan DD-metalloendopeptidase family protein, partial [Candidatus Dojkabacteria bacterium]|nr:peptidoglycan DD-metalloendopeptidase family protein [Candidatus Dojkabacteria bacterium]
CKVECPEGYSYYPEYSRCLKDFLGGSAHPYAQSSSCKGPDVVYGGDTGDDDFGYKDYDGNQHNGVDIRPAVSSSCQINPVAGGEVVLVSKDRYGGIYMDVDHGNGYKTRYVHASKNLIDAGERVEITDYIQDSGCTGRCDVPHIHFALLKDTDSNYLDPQLSQHFSYMGKDFYKENPDGSVRYNYQGSLFNTTKNY